MTAVEWLQDKWGNCKEWKWEEIQQWFEQAKEMEKELMQDFGARCCLMTKQKNEWTLEGLYNDLYGSKGSDEINNIIKNDTSVMLVCDDCGMENCDCGLTDDEITIRYLHKQLTSSQTEISDEEIEKSANYFYPLLGEQSKKALWVNGCKWYREQLKKKQ